MHLARQGLMDSTSAVPDSPARSNTTPLPTSIDPPRGSSFQLQPGQSFDVQELHMYLQSSSLDHSSHATPLPPTKKTHDLGPINRDDIYLSKLPTCSLNLVCYRAGQHSCVKTDVEVTTDTKWLNASEEARKHKKRDSLVSDDEQFFRALKDKYEHDMGSIFRRWLCFTTIRRFRLLSVCIASIMMQL